MGMSTHIVAFKDRKEHDKHLRIRQMCIEEGVSLPRETAAYFGDDSEGIDPNAWNEYELEERLETSLGGCVSKWGREMEDGFEIDVDYIPKDVKKIRFYNSY
jgi:hypothetical protein